MTQQEQEFLSLLQQETDCAKQLLVALKAENATLRKLDAEKIERSTQTKIQHIKALEQAASHCMVWLKRTSPNAITTTVSEYVKDLFPKNTQLIQLLEEVKQLAHDCQKLNEVNGGIIALSQQYTQRALAILHGDTPGMSLYGKEGKTTQRYSQKTLGKV